MPERRRFSRIRRRLVVDYEHQKRRYTGYSYDLSATGLFICSDYLPKLESRLRIRIRVPKQECILLHVRVVRVPARLTQFVPGGFSVRLEHPDQQYFQLVASLARAAA